MQPAATFEWVLPVSGRGVALRQPTGADELFLLEAAGSEPARAIAFVSALAPDGLDAATLPVTDLDVLLLLLRRALLGDRVLAEGACPSANCRAHVDVTFGIDRFLAHYRPRLPRLVSWQVAPCPEQSGWFRLARRDLPAVMARFRLPTAGDERDIGEDPHGGAALARRCIAPDPPPPGARRAAEAAMAALAPALAAPLAGTCPECGHEVAVPFDPRRYVVAELSARARFLAEDMDLLAGRYHWTERAILDLPSSRRATYAEMARRAA
jgi:hypothetical protein